MIFCSEAGWSCRRKGIETIRDEWSITTGKNCTQTVNEWRTKIVFGVVLTRFSMILAISCKKWPVPRQENLPPFEFFVTFY